MWTKIKNYIIANPVAAMLIVVTLGLAIGWILGKKLFKKFKYR